MNINLSKHAYNSILRYYDQNIKLRKWLSWEEYKKLKVGDILILPAYDDEDNVIGEEIITIDALYTDIDENHNIVLGKLSGDVHYNYNNSFKYSDDRSFGTAGTYAICFNDNIESCYKSVMRPYKNMQEFNDDLKINGPLIKHETASFMPLSINDNEITIINNKTIPFKELLENYHWQNNELCGRVTYQ